MEIKLTPANEKRKKEIVDEYAERHNWPAVTRLIGGSPRYDLQDYTDSDASGSHPDDREF